MKIDLTQSELKIIKDLLQQYLSNVEVWAFGSRVKFTAKPSSDLDLAVFINEKQETNFSQLKEALTETSLPFRIDLHNWYELPETFHQNIKADYVILQENKKQKLPPGWKVYKLGDLIDINKNSISKNYPFDEIEFAVITPKKVEPAFLYYYLTRNKVVNYLNGVAEANTTTFPAFNSSLFETLEITIPESIETQKEIAAILSSLDDKIELNLQMNKTLEAIAQAIFKEWLAYSYTFYTMRSIQSIFQSYEGEETVFGSINKGNFENIETICPDEKIIADFEIIVNPIDERIYNNFKEIKTLTQIRDSLLPKLMSGSLNYD